MEPRRSRSNLCIHRSRADRSSDGQYLSFAPDASLHSWNQLRWTATWGYIPVSLCCTSMNIPQRTRGSTFKIQSIKFIFVSTTWKSLSPEPKLFHKTLIFRNSHNSCGDCGLVCGRRWRRPLTSPRLFLVVGLDYPPNWEGLVSNSPDTQVHYIRCLH